MRWYGSFLVMSLAGAGLAACAEGGPGPGTGGSGGVAGTGGSTTTSSGGGGSGGTGSVTMICEPGSTISCYTGPSGTLGVGACKAGVQTCNAAGTGYGLCEGEVLPKPEVCGTPADDDCDGTPFDEDIACVCLPNVAVPCYTGPMGTEGVGICKGGMATCDATGTVLGPCVGEVVPEMELCTTPEDEDCDGDAALCGVQVWAKRFGSSSSQIAKGLAVQPDGTSVLTGYIYGNTVFDSVSLTSAGSSDAFVAKLGPGGGVLWARAFGDSGNQEGRAIAVDAAGAMAVTGFFTGAIDFGGGALTTAGSNDAFLAKLDTAGNHVWSKAFGNNSNQYGNAVAIAPNGDVILGGHYGGTIDFGGGVLTSAGGTDAFVAAFAANGNHKWSKGFGNANNQATTGVAVTPLGNVVVAGNFEGQIDLGGGQLSTAGLNDIFVASYGTGGNHLWSKSFGGAGQQYAYAVATSASGDIALTGMFTGTVDFGCGALTSAVGNDVFVAVLDSSGQCVFSNQYGDAQDQSGLAVSFDAAGNVLVTGTFAGTVTFGPQVLTSAGGTDVLIAKIDPTGAPVWAARAGDGGDQMPLGIRADAMNNLYVTGGFPGSIDFGGGALTSTGAEDIFVVKLLP